MGPETALAVLNLDDRMVQLSLTGGTLQVRLRDLGQGESFEVDTPNAAVTLLRAGEYRFFVDADQNLSMVTVRSGDVEVIGGGRAFVVHARESGRFTGNDDNFTNQVDSAPLSDEFEFWCQDRDRREDQSQSVSHVSRETIGYEDLDANGSWSDVPDYGWVWAPRVNAGWAPYRDGRWAWVEPWGWTWIDAAPWGFAPFHYGRWANYRGGWVWSSRHAGCASGLRSRRWWPSWADRAPVSRSPSAESMGWPGSRSARMRFITPGTGSARLTCATSTSPTSPTSM